LFGVDYPCGFNATGSLAFERQTLVSLGDAKAGRILDMLAIDLRGHIDIQYQPLLPAAGNAIMEYSLVREYQKLWEEVDGEIRSISGSAEKRMESR
jgi:hypothetical protein